MRFPKIVIKLGWVSLLADISSEMAYPVLPLFLTAIGAPAAALGIIEGLSESTVGFIKAATGFRSDLLKSRTPYIGLGYFLSALGKPIVGFATFWPIAIVGRVLDRIGKGIRTAPRDALISQVVDKSRHGAAYGFHRMMDNTGAFLGVIVALLMMHFWPGQYRWVFWAALIPGLAAAALARSVREPVREQPAEDAVKPSFGDVARKMTPAFWKVMVVACVFALANTSDTFLLLRAKSEGLSDVLAIILYALFNLVAAIVAYPAGHLSDRLGKRASIAVSWTLYGIAYLLAANGSASLLWTGLLLYGVFSGIYQGAVKALVVELAPVEWKASALGIFFLFTATCTLLGNLAAGIVWDRLGPAFMLTACAALAFVAALALPLLSSRRIRAA